MWAALLAFGALVALVISWNVKRSRLWIAMIMAGYFIPRFFDLSDIGSLYHVYALNIIVDASICVLIDRYAEKEDEVLLFRIYKLSTATSVVFFGAQIGLDYFGSLQGFMPIYFEMYGILLEAFNWTALAVITRTGWKQWNGRHHPFLSWRPDIKASREALRAPRRSHSWQHK